MKVTNVVPARGDAATLQLFILIDDTLDTSIGNQLQDLKGFIKAQPSSTQVGIGYMSNATFDAAYGLVGLIGSSSVAARLTDPYISDVPI